MNLIQILTAIVVAYLRGSYPIKDLASVMSVTNRAAAAALIPELKEAYAAYDKGKEFDWVKLSAGISRYLKEYTATSGARSSHIKALKTYALYYKSSSEPALRTIEKYSAAFQDPFLRSAFQKDVTAQKDVVVGLTPLVKRLGGKGVDLTQEERQVAKEADPITYKQFLALRKEYVDSWKVPLSNFVRTSGQETVPIEEALAHLKSHGLKSDLPSGFIGRIDANGNWYTMQGEKIAGGAPSVTMFPTVRMNPAYDGDESPWVFQAIRADGTPANYAYTENQIRSQQQKKFARVADFDAEATRKKWLPLLNSLDPEYPEQTNVAALVLEILYRTSNRIGTKVISNPKSGGFGISTLLRAHLYPQPDGSVKFIYLGKDSVKTVALIKKTDDAIAAKVCKFVTALAQGKGPKDPIFTYTQKNGLYRIVGPGAVNKLFKICSGNPELTAHKLRTHKGTKIFRAYLDELFSKRKSMNPVQVMDALKKGATMVGKELNHVKRTADGEDTIQWSTSTKNYIDVDLQAELFLHYGAPIPAYLEKLMNLKEERIMATARRIVASLMRGDAMEDEEHMVDTVEKMVEEDKELPEGGEEVKKAPDLGVDDDLDECIEVPSADLLIELFEDPESVSFV